MNSRSSEFGIVLSCYRGDYPFAQGCCASIRACDWQTPICLIVDGAFSVEDLKRAYGVTALYPDDVDPRLRQSFGYGLTKMVSFWQSPFDRFMHIDADTVWWGDVLKDLPWKQYDIIYNEPHETITPDIQRSQYFDPDKLFAHVPYFPWEKQPYFNTGCFVARKGLLDLNEYLSLVELQSKQRDIFISGEQGILNYMIFKRIAAGEITARAWPLQAVVPVVPKQDLQRRFRIAQGRPVVNEADRRVIHWAGRKPYLTTQAASFAFLEPMAHYRREYLRRAESPLKMLGRLGLIYDEMRARATAHQYASIWQYVGSKMRFFAKKIAARLLRAKSA